jgi:phosphoribosylformimino-5-aminoimidazole carboxamide ribonucleotide (ProFAR) isomerase
VRIEQEGLVRADVLAAGGMKRLADINAARAQVGAGGLDVGDNKIKPLR